MADIGTDPNQEQASSIPTPTIAISDRIDAMAAAIRTGRLRSYEERVKVLVDLRRLLVEREQEFANALQADLGKSSFEAYLTEIGPVLNEIEHTLSNLNRWLRPGHARVPLLLSPGKAWIRHDPLGVVLIIAPWNYPLHLALAPLVAALAGGNAVVVAPSEVAPHTSAALECWLPQYLTPDVVTVTVGDAEVKQRLVNKPFDHIFFTGSREVGKQVMREAAERLTPVTLELGGKSPALVCPSANLTVAARRIAWGKFLNAGQTCVAPDYLLVTEAVYAEFVPLLRASIEELFGSVPADSDDYARIINASHFDRLEGLLATAGGETTQAEGHDRSRLYFGPTLVEDPALDSALMTEEIFGPILPIIRVPDTDAAVDFVVQRPHPLALYVFSNDRAETKRVLDRTRSGGAAVNHTVLQIAVPGLPFGGVGPSGMGSYHGRAGFDSFTHARSVLRRATAPDLKLAYPPYDSRARRLLRKLF